MRKWKPKETEEERKAATPKKEVPLKEEAVNESEFDKYLKGERTGITVLYEDDKCLAFNDRYPVAKTHFLVLAKTTEITRMSQAERDPELMGHMMVVVAKVARAQKLEEGYRVVVNNSRRH